MPPVRWKLAIAVAAICLARIPSGSATRTQRELAENGWKPIVGPGYAKDLTKYRNPPSTSEPIPPPQPPPPKPTASTLNNHQNGPPKHKTKVKHQHFHFGANPGHGHQIPMNFITHRSQNKPYIMGKPYNGKRVVKPPRMQAAAHSNREEVFVAAPSTAIGNYAYFAQGPGSLKTRLPPHGHIDFGNRFAPSEDFFQFQRLPVQQYVLPKFQIPNDVHYMFQAQNDEYTRNLVPPLPAQKFPEVKNTKHKQQTVTEQPLVTKPVVEQMQTSLIPENILVQVPPAYQQQQTYYLTQQNEPVDVQVTKEKLNVFHNSIPVNYNQQFAQFGRYQFEKKPISEPPKSPTYEVTEGKQWQQTPEYQFQYASQATRRPQILQQSQVEKVVEFLPTPLKPEGSLPTSATQSEISTVYSEVSKINRHKEMLGDPSFYNAKEVSTHYPILGQPEVKQQFNLQFTTPNQDNPEYSNEITTVVSNQQQQQQPEITEMPTVPPSPITIPSRDWQHKRRPGHRRRKPTRPTTPEAIEEQKISDADTTPTTPRERPLRRRPSRYRTPINEDPQPVRTRQRQRPRPTEEMPHNHKLTTEYYRGGSYNQRTPEGFDKFGKYDDGEELQQRRRPTKYRIKEESEETQSSEMFTEKSEEQQYTIEEVTPNEPTEPEEETKSRRPISTTEQISTTNIHTPENEIDYSTVNPTRQETITIEEIHTQTPERTEETTTAVATTSTTTTEVTTTKANRLRRPISYKSSPRPRFSLKEHNRQRLTSTTTETNTRPSTESAPRLRYPYRSRKPIMRYQQEVTEEETEVPRTKFVPKSPRYTSTTEARPEEDDVIKTRVRPFGRNRPTTEATTTTQKVSIKPNIFSNLRRPPQVSLRNRIFNKYNRNSTTEKTTTTTEDENLDNETSEIVESTEAFERQLTSTESGTPEFTTVKASVTTSVSEVATTDVLRNEAVLQSQRVSDLTSSAQNDYNTPGIFKSVSSNVRRVPSYFTIATDDPILPIEAFFTNINKEKEAH